MTISIVDHELPYDTHNTYDVVFFGHSVFTTVTHDPATANLWISDVVSAAEGTRLIVGLDVEWRPSFNRHIQNPAATLQLCVGRRCLIYLLIHAPEIPKSLIDFVENPEHTFVGIGIEADLEKLDEDYEFGMRANAVDLRGLAADKCNRKELKNSGLKELAVVVLGKEVKKPKSVTMSRWDKRWLTPDQVQYACVDALVCCEIGKTLILT